ncbi:hypothetical protein BC830DRAFT_1117909 [Chytriomyces sp. MP71]|nr:hypothetical protein BC830DRAFT_1117909 [Chytriomyces sp. MP71]
MSATKTIAVSILLSALSLASTAQARRPVKAAAAVPLREAAHAPLAHSSSDSYEGQHCDTTKFLYTCSDVDPAQMYTCGPAGYAATWQKMPRCTGGTVCKADGSYAGCVYGEGDSDYDYSYEKPTTTNYGYYQPTTTEDDYYDYQPTTTENYYYEQPTTDPSYEYKKTTTKPSYEYKEPSTTPSYGYKSSKFANFLKSSQNDNKVDEGGHVSKFASFLKGSKELMADTSIPSTIDVPQINVAFIKVPITGTMVIESVIMILFGIAFLFFGHKFFKAVLFLYGLGIGGVLTIIVLLATGEHPLWMYIVIGLAVGIAFGIALALLWRIGIFVVGLSLGFWFAVVIEVACSGFWTGSTSRLIVAGVCALAGGILAQFFDMQVAVLSTAYHGAFLLATGVDILAQTGFNNILANLSSSADPTTGVDGKAWIGILVGLVVFLILGCVFQWHQVKKFGHSLSVMKGHHDLGVKGAAPVAAPMPTTYAPNVAYQPLDGRV